MKTKTFLIWFLLILVLVSCQSATQTPPLSTPTPSGQMETRVAATIYANETSTTAAQLSPFKAAFTRIGQIDLTASDVSSVLLMTFNVEPIPSLLS